MMKAGLCRLPSIARLQGGQSSLSGRPYVRLVGRCGPLLANSKSKLSGVYSGRPSIEGLATAGRQCSSSSGEKDKKGRVLDSSGDDRLVRPATRRKHDSGPAASTAAPSASTGHATETGAGLGAEANHEPAVAAAARLARQRATPEAAAAADAAKAAEVADATAAATASAAGAAGVTSATGGRVSEALRSVNHTYEELEMNLMHRIHESSKNRFRGYLIGSVLLLLWIVAIFGDKIYKAMSRKTADFAKETLENESLKTQTQELATAVVQTVLNDKEITSQAATFLQQASQAPETQAAFYQLTMHVLQHPETLKEVTVLGKHLVNALAEDPDVTAKLAQILTQVLADPELKDAVVRLIVELTGDPAVIAATSQLVMDLMVREDVKQATAKLLTESSSEVLEDPDISIQSKEFVADVMRDARLQKEGGDALMNSITHALKPGLVKITGTALIGISLAVIKLMLSPY